LPLNLSHAHTRRSKNNHRRLPDAKRTINDSSESNDKQRNKQDTMVKKKAAKEKETFKELEVK
jgi:hypothetical protein